MVLPCTLPSLKVALVVMVSCTAWSLAEKRLLCSSETGSIWYEYEGPLYYATASVSPCYFGISTLNINYTVISMFTAKLFGYHFTMQYQSKQWLEFSQPLGPCKGLKICNLLKGETFHDSFSVRLKTQSGTELPGEYLAFFRLHFIDDFDREFTVNATLTLHVLQAPQLE